MSRNIRLFIAVSLLIHLVGGVTLYKYYATPPPPQPVSEEKVNGLQAETVLPASSFKNQGNLLKNPKRAQSPSKKGTRPGQKRVTPVKPLSSPKSKIVPENRPDKNTEDPLPEKTTDSSRKGVKISEAPVKEQDTQKISDKSAGSVTGKIASPEERGGDQGGLSDKPSAGEQPKPKSDLKAHGKEIFGETAAAPVEKASLPSAKERLREETFDNPLKTTSSNGKGSSKTGKEDEISGGTTSPPNRKGEPSTISEGKGKTDPMPVSSHPSSSVPFRNFLDLKQKRGNPKLNYPKEAREKQLQGSVAIVYFVSSEGLVDKIQLKQSSGHSLLDNFVLRTVARYEFLPRQEGWVQHTVDFVLDGEEKQILKLRDRDE